MSNCRVVTIHFVTGSFGIMCNVQYGYGARNVDTVDDSSNLLVGRAVTTAGMQTALCLETYHTVYSMKPV